MDNKQTNVIIFGIENLCLTFCVPPYKYKFSIPIFYVPFVYMLYCLWCAL